LNLITISTAKSSVHPAVYYYIIFCIIVRCVRIWHICYSLKLLLLMLLLSLHTFFLFLFRFTYNIITMYTSYACYFIYDCNGSLNWQLSKVVCLAQHVSADMIFCSLNVLPHFIKSTFLRLLNNTKAYLLTYYIYTIILLRRRKWPLKCQNNYISVSHTYEIYKKKLQLWGIIKINEKIIHVIRYSYWHQHIMRIWHIYLLKSEKFI